jgi:hypothetical protein
MENKLQKAHGFHFNYTGGTKSMSTHVYWILKEIQNKGQNSFSYLDARNFRLVQDNQGVIAADLRNEVSINFQELIALHGFKRSNKLSDFIFSEAVKVFKYLIDDNNLDKLYENGGYDRELFKNIKITFSISDASLKKLITYGIDQSIIEKLAKMIGSTWDKKDLFLKTLKSTIGDKLYSLHKDLILKHTDIIKEDKGLAEKPGQLDKDKINAFIPNHAFKAIMDKMPEEYRFFSNEGKFNWDISKKKFKKTMNLLMANGLKHISHKYLSNDLRVPIG